MAMQTCQLTVTTTGEAGSATGSVTSPIITGYIYDIYVDYHADAPNTTDVTIAYGTPAGGNILAKANSATDTLYVPRKATCDNAASALTWYEQFYIDGTFTIAVAECDALAAALVVTVRYDPNDLRRAR